MWKAWWRRPHQPMTGSLRPPSEPRLGVAEPAVVYLDGQAELERRLPPIHRVLLAQVDIGAGSERFCPVQFQDRTVALLVRDGWQDSDQVRELERMLQRQGFALAQPSRWVVPVPLLLAIVRGQATAAVAVGTVAPGLERRGHMAAAFLDMVTWGFDHEASDLHINILTAAAESEVRYSIAGRYVAPERFARMPTATLHEILAVAWMDIQGGNGAVFDPRVEQQGRLGLTVRGRPVMLRWASLATDAGPSVCLRLLRLDARAERDLAGLGYLPQQVVQLEQACQREGGAVVLAGVVGSGKSTTIATVMSAIPASHKVITLEDPVEYRIPGALQSTVARTLDDRTSGVFDAKLKTIKRSAMQDLLVGEVRDQDTGRAFMDLAGSGISVFTTVHAGSALLIPDRLASDFIGVSRDFLATPGILKLLVYQALLPALCPYCARSEPDTATAAEQSAWELARQRFCRRHGVAGTAMRVRDPAGCEHCRRAGLPELAGWRGRTVVAEIVEPAADDQFLINLRTADNVAQRQHWRRQRVASLDAADMRGKSAMECAIYKVCAGEIDLQDFTARYGAADAGGRHD